MKCLQEFKSSTEFRNCDLMLKKSNYMKVWGKSLAEINEDELGAFGPAPVSENPYKDLDDINEIDLREYRAKVKHKRSK